ncbi:MAG: peptidoglycan DD-metalloendopeptidase family protein [Candidatus Omnitrophota bacterium]|nr:peptidoglycan DD-metalloendopeptidase family protein [Candidatus Omnitrophota bacterium]MDZ4242331.1 peptidoglycan DD-metalloendopeptidase family protein [Candidatus Omnitrophota bacterium]
MVVLLAPGCAVVQSPSDEPIALPPRQDQPKPPAPQKGIYHKVGKGETIWRIANAYHVKIDDIIKINNIPNVAHIEENQLLFIPGAGSSVAVPVDEPIPQEKDFIWPLQGRVLFYFGDRKGSYLSKGIGIEAAEGQDVAAARSGRVVFSDFLGGYGHMVILDHLDGFLSIYSQNQESLVKVGDRVSQGQPISRVGKNGGNSFLHFEIRKNASADNPMYYLPRE